MLEHSILMNARLMGKGIRTDNRLVRLDNHAGVIADEFADARNLCGINARFQLEDGMAGLQRHHHFFERCIAVPFTDAIDGHFRLTRACANAGQSIGRCHSEIVMAMNRDRDAVMHSGRVLDDTVNQIEEFIGRGVTHGIGNIQCGRAGFDRFTQNDI